MKRCNCLICDPRVILIMGNNSVPVYDDASPCKLTGHPVATGLRLSRYGNELLIIEGWRFSVLSGRILEFSNLLACRGVRVLIGPLQTISVLLFTHQTGSTMVKLFLSNTVIILDFLSSDNETD